MPIYNLDNQEERNLYAGGSKYEVVYQHHTWVVVDSKTNEGVVCFPTQIGAINWIKNQSHAKKNQSPV